MKYLTDKEYQQKLEKIKSKNKQKEYRKLLKNEREKLNTKFKLETSKMIAVYLFILLNAIVVYAMIAMWKFMDLSYLGVLISDIAAQVLIYAIYCLKAYKAKKSEEDLKFKREQYSCTLENIIEMGAESNEYVPLNKDSNTFVTTADYDSAG